MVNHVILASDNPHKFTEFSAMLKDICVLRPQTQWALSTPPETAMTFAENAAMKAWHVYTATGLPALSDDSGLVVDALSGAPGILSARYAGEGAGDEANMIKLLQAIKRIPSEDLTASFHCVIAYMDSTMTKPLLAHAVWNGRLVRKPAGNNGFGYDPIFYVPQYGCTAAQLPAAVKNTISHRALSLRRLCEVLEHHFR